MNRQTHLTKEAKNIFRKFFESIGKETTPGNVSRMADDVTSEGKMRILSNAYNWAVKHPILAFGAGTVALGAPGVVKDHVVDPIMLKIDQVKAYKNMEKAVPALKGIDEDKKRAYFNIVAQFAPNLSRNPYVVGNVVHKINEFGGADTKLIAEIVKTQKDMNLAGSDSFDKMIGRAGAIAGGII